ncbi:cupin domain-containing protein [Radiobacillus deserti]|uniref:Cupin domain-containing protein n=2 Tax=Radiobacillus deserti TaxID=2594883 RepID=A0A516KEV4_9BACI|nr:cupin domain-containing protein [Radiobacillus deserti]
MDKVNVTEKFKLFNEHWSPKIVGEVNDAHIKLAKLKGEFEWHYHEKEDEMFFVIKGRLLLRLRDKDIWLEEGEFFIVPRGVEHLPIAKEEVHVLFVEPKTTLNTGTEITERTVTDLPTL